MRASYRMVLPAALVGMALAAGLGLMRFLNAEPGVRTSEWFGTLAFSLVLAAPAVLALLGLRGRPTLILAGGAIGIFFAAIGAFSLVSLVLLLPSVAYLVGAARVEGLWPGALRTAAAVLLSLVLGWSAFLVLFIRDDPICWAEVSRDGGSTYVRLPPERFVRGTSITMSSKDLPPGSTSSGCSGDSISPSEAASSLAVVGLMLGAAWLLGTPRPPHDSAPEAH